MGEMFMQRTFGVVEEVASSVTGETGKQRNVKKPI
jgi:hypothetical protein